MFCNSPVPLTQRMQRLNRNPTCRINKINIVITSILLTIIPMLSYMTEREKQLIIDYTINTNIEIIDFCKNKERKDKNNG